MIALICFWLTLFALPFKSKSRLEAENAALRHQVIVLQRRVSGRVQLTNGDRLFLVMLYRWFPSVLKTITIIRPETPNVIEGTAEPVALPAPEAQSPEATPEPTRKHKSNRLMREADTAVGPRERTASRR